jgi:hypothetical protein
MKHGRMRWEKNVARMMLETDANNVLVEPLKGRDHMEHLGVNVRIILKWEIVNKINLSQNND